MENAYKVSINPPERSGCQVDATRNYKHRSQLRGIVKLRFGLGLVLDTVCLGLGSGGLDYITQTPAGQDRSTGPLSTCRESCSQTGLMLIH